MNFCGTVLEYFRERNLRQFQENSYLMRHFYIIIFVQFNETRTLVYNVYIWVGFGIIFVKEKEALS